MHRLTDPMKWGCGAMWAGVVIGSWAWLSLGQSGGMAIHLDLEAMLVPGILCEMAAGVTLAVMMSRTVDRRGRTAVITLAWGMAVLPWLLLPLAWTIPYPRPYWLLVAAAAVVPLVLLVMLVRMRQWTALGVALIGLTGAVLGTCALLRFLDGLE